MLVAALAFAAVGFGLLVVALISGNVMFAWACMAAGVVGVVLLILDVIRGRGDGDEG